MINDRDFINQANTIYIYISPAGGIFFVKRTTNPAREKEQVNTIGKHVLISSLNIG